MKITIWGDFACPFCYMEEYMLENILKERTTADGEAIEIELRAYELSPDAPIVPEETMEEHFCSSHGITPEEARGQMSRISKMAARAGLNYNLEGVKVCSTFDAHRLMKLAYETSGAATALALNFALFHANFIENKLLSDHEVLKEIALSVGLKADDIESTLASGKYTDAVRTDEKEADDMGLEYIPYMRLPDGGVIQGVLTVGAIRDALKNIV